MNGLPSASLSRNWNNSMEDDRIEKLIKDFDNMSSEEQEEFYRAITKRAIQRGEDWYDSLDLEEC
jgi:hypothetical protein